MMNSNEMTNKRALLREKKSFLFNYFNIGVIKNYWLKKKIKVMNYNYFSLIKNFIKKDNFYYDCILIFAKNITAVNHPSSAVSYSKNHLYCLADDKIKEIYEKIYLEYKKVLTENIKEESETEKNIMKNISDIFIDFCSFYIGLFPKDIISVLIKLGTIIILLKSRKYKDLNLRNLFLKTKSLIYLPISEKYYKKIDEKYSGRNNIILNELKNLKIIDKIKQENKAYYDIIKQVLNFAINIFNDENAVIKLALTNDKIDKNINILNDGEKTFLIFRLKEYIIDTLDKNDELYK